MGVLRSSLLNKPGEAAIGLSISDGKVPEAGVCSDDAAVFDFLSSPAAARVAFTVAEFIPVCRRLDKRVTKERSKE